MKRELLIAGGTGLIGSAIKEEALRMGWEVVILSRNQESGGIVWNPNDEHISISAPRSFDAIINLAGTPIAGKRWTSARRKDILDSRVQASRTLEKYLKSGMLSTKCYIGSSAIGIYGDKCENVVAEHTPIGSTSDWMVQTVVDWEDAHNRIASLGIRTVILRTGIVLSPKGGALKEILQTAAFGIIGYFGNGRQYWPWIHIDDMVAIFVKAITELSMEGVYVAVAPESISNKALSQAAAGAFQRRRLVVPVPGFILAIILGSMKSMLLQSCRGYPARLMEENFSFRYPDIESAMKALMQEKKK